MNLIHIPSFICSVPDPKAKDGTIKLVCRLNEEATAIVITACASNGTVFTASFDEAELSKINNAADGSLDSDSFQKAMETAFSSKQVTASEASNHQLTIQFKAGGGQASFTLQQQNDGHAVVKFVEQMFELYNLRTDVQTREALMKETVRKQEEMKKKEASLQEEKKKQQEAMQQAQEEEKQAMEEYNKLNKEFQALQHKIANDKSKDSTVDILAPSEPNLNACVGRYPLGAATSRQYDQFLMRMIKSKFTPLDEDVEEGDTPPEHMKVLRPFSKNEYEAQLKNLPDDTRRLIMNCMQKIDDWDFDVFAMQDFTDRGSLFHTAYALFVRYDFLRKFQLDEQIVLNFLSQVEAGYHPNPYHNSMHAADVLHILHYILSPGQLAKIAKLTEEDIFASLIAGMIHDYDHPGINNNFHIKVQSYLATLYNDRSILENHHCAEVFEIVKNPTYNVLSAFSEEQRRDIRETVIEMVLSTDMGLHAKILGTWKRRIAQDTDLHARKDDQRLALSMAIKMADISNCGRPEHLYLRWASKIAEEFFLQGDRERNLGNPVSPFMDRYVPSMSKGQIAFMNFIVIPLFESISEYLPEMHFSVDHCEHNKNYWAANDDTI